MDQELPMQFGIAMDSDGVPVVVLILPGLPDPETGEGTNILIGDSDEARTFATYVVQAALVAEDMAEELGEAPHEERVAEITKKYASKLSAPFN